MWYTSKARRALCRKGSDQQVRGLRPSSVTDLLPGPVLSSVKWGDDDGGDVSGGSGCKSVSAPRVLRKYV